jgi:hypothetical protein
MAVPVLMVAVVVLGRSGSAPPWVRSIRDRLVAEPRASTWAGIIVVCGVLAGLMIRHEEAKEAAQRQATPAPTPAPVAKEVTAAECGSRGLDLLQRVDALAGRLVPECGLDCRGVTDRLVKRCARNRFTKKLLDADKRSAHTSTKTATSVDGLPVLSFFTFADGPEWLATRDGELLTVSGMASSACPSLPSVSAYQRRARVAAAPKRGHDVKTYEGLYNAAGNYKFEDCSEFEITIADLVHEETFRKPDSSEADIRRRVSKRTGLAAKIALGIYSKAMNQCGWIAPGPQ